jgi:hypothetical protein
MTESRYKDWEPLLEAVESALLRLNDQLSAIWNGKWIIGIPWGMSHKGLNTFRAIRLLYVNSLPMEAQALIRILAETRIDLEYFLHLCADDPIKAVVRVSDSMMLQKFKQQRQSEFAGHDLVEGAPSPEMQQHVEDIIVTRHGKELAKQMRAYGFSGRSVEQRAQYLGLDDLYNVIYRNFSRNIHGTDYMEYARALGLVGTESEASHADYEYVRDRVALSTALTCAMRVGMLASEAFAPELIDGFKAVWEQCHKFESWAPIPG